MKLSVLSIAYPLAPIGPDAAGGSEQILTRLDRTLARGGHRSVVIACEGSRAEGTLLATPRPAGTLDDAAREAAQESYRKTIRFAMSRWDFDVIHMHSLDFHAYLPPEGPPVLVTLHLPPDWYPAGAFRPARPRTWLHCVSASQMRNCPPTSALLPYIENGVPLEDFECRVSKRNFALALGRICPEKGFHLALDAAAAAGMPLLVAGEVFRYRAHEEYFEKEILPRCGAAGWPARDAASARGSVARFVGPVGLSRKRRLLAAARCLLIPSLVPETSSLVAMEALASGTPVIAFPSGALPEIIEHGRTGFLVEGPAEMARAIQEVDRIQPEACRAAARARFSADRMIGQYLGLYERLARFGIAHTAEAAGNRAF